MQPTKESLLKIIRIWFTDRTIISSVSIAGAAELGAPVIEADVGLGGVGAAHREGRCRRRAVGRGHASLLAILHTGHYKTVRGIAQL